MESDDYRLVRVSTPDEWIAYHRIRRQELFEARGRMGVYDESHHDEYVSGNTPLLLKFQGTGVGTTRLDIREGGQAIIRLVAITKSEQRKGHGRELAARVEQFAKQSGARKMLVNSAADASGFYEKLGYVREVWDQNELLACAPGVVQMTKILE